MTMKVNDERAASIRERARRWAPDHIGKVEVLDLLDDREDDRALIERQAAMYREMFSAACPDSPYPGERDALMLVQHRVRQLLDDSEEDKREIRELQQAVGLMTTIKPSMVIDVRDPIGMAHEMVAEVEGLRKERDTARNNSELIAVTLRVLERERDEARAEVEGLSDRCADLIAENDKLRAVIEARDGVNARLLLQRDEARAEVAGLKSELKHWYDKLQAADAEVERLTKECDGLRRSIRLARRRHSMWNSRLD